MLQNIVLASYSEVLITSGQRFLAAHANHEQDFGCVYHEGSNPVASALTIEVNSLRLHQRQEIVDPIYYPPASARSLHT